MSQKSDRRAVLKALGATGIGAILAGCTGGGDGDGDDGDDGGDGDGGDGGATMTETTTETDMGDGGDGDGGATMTETETETETATATEMESDVNVGMVYATGGLGDGSFNDQAQQGVLQAQEDFGISFQESQPEEVSDFAPAQQQYAASGDFDLVCCIGFLQADALGSNAGNYPDQRFMIVDSVVDSSNVASYVFREHEGSFLVGHLAGRLTSMDFSAGAGSTSPDSSTVGFVGGVESDLIRRFQAGFEAGVANANEDASITTSYVGSFSDPAGGQEAALAMYNDGADVVYHASGNTGRGVFQAAQQEGKFAIGVDRDQSVTQPSFSDVILASMVKRVDTAVYNSIESVVGDEFPGGSVTTLGLAEDGVAITYGTDLGSEIPSDVRDEITSARQGIIDGEISVPTSPS
jgi:basic membrane protein A